METMVKISKWIEKYMAVIVLFIAVVSLFVPASFKWIDTSWINYLLMIVMFGMGLTIKPTDFAIVFTRPKDIIVGCVSQFVFMPLIAFLLCKLFSLDDALSSSRPVEADSNQIKTLMEKNPCYTMPEIPERLKISKSRVENHFHPVWLY